jgi:hypothetical protein
VPLNTDKSTLKEMMRISTKRKLEILRMALPESNPIVFKLWWDGKSIQSLNSASPGKFMILMKLKDSMVVLSPLKMSEVVPGKDTPVKAISNTIWILSITWYIEIGGISLKHDTRRIRIKNKYIKVRIRGAVKLISPVPLQIIFPSCS